LLKSRADDLGDVGVHGGDVVQWKTADRSDVVCSGSIEYQRRVDVAQPVPAEPRSGPRPVRAHAASLRVPR